MWGVGKSPGPATRESRRAGEPEVEGLQPREREGVGGGVGGKVRGRGEGRRGKDR